MEDHERRDLAAMLQPVARALIEAELPVLARHGITMWGYVVLNALHDAPESTQAALADKIGADKTRIIATLNDLQAAGLISARAGPGGPPGPAAVDHPGGQPRPARGAGRDTAQRGARARRLPPADRRAFLRAADRLSSLPVARILAGPPARDPGARSRGRA